MTEPNDPFLPAADALGDDGPLRAVEAEITVNADAHACYEAWADPRGIARWFVDRAEGRAEAGASVTWFWDAFGYAVPYQIHEAVPDERLVYGFEAPGRPPGRIEIDLHAEGGGVTRVTLVNHGFRDGAQWDEEYQGVVSGWQMALATMKRSLEGFAGQARLDLLITHPATIDFARTVTFQRTGTGLASWLGESADLSPVGAPVKIESTDLGTLTGEVLATTDIETLISWEEESGTLGLKTFRMGPMGMVVALHASSWAWSEADQERVRPLLEKAVERWAQAAEEGAPA